jgi:hypothetical protein
VRERRGARVTELTGLLGVSDMSSMSSVRQNRQSAAGAVRTTSTSGPRTLRIATIQLNDPYYNWANLATSPPAHSASIVGDAEVDC